MHFAQLLDFIERLDVRRVNWRKKYDYPWLGMLAPEEQRRIGAALAALPLAMEVETAAGPVGLVHADCPFDDWREMQAVRWGSAEPTDALGECCLQSFERYTRRYAAPVRNVRAVVHGHVVLKAPEVLGNVHFIDTGGWKPGGCFTLLELATLQAVSGPVVAGTALNPPNRRNRQQPWLRRASW